MAESAVRFIRWWAGELAACLPERLRPGFGPDRKSLLVEMDRDRVILKHRNGQKDSELIRIDLSGATPVQLRKVVKGILRKARLGSAKVVFCLDDERVLRQTVHLPTAAAENLREVLGFELDRYTPFNAREAYYDFQIVGTDVKHKRIAVDLAVTTSDSVHQAFDVAKLLDLEPTRLGLNAAPGSKDAGYNFLPPKPAKVHGRLWRGITAVAALGLALLVASALYLPIKAKQDAVRSLEARLAQARIEADETERLKARFDHLLERSEFVVRQKCALTRVTELIDEVTRILPDDTWLLELDLKDDTLGLTGYSSKALGLVEKLEDSRLLSNARFASPVRQDGRVGADRFTLTALVAQNP